MRPVTVTVAGSSGGPTTNGTSVTIPMDDKQAPFAVGIGTYVTSGQTATWSVQHTFDDLTVSGGTLTWFTNSGINAVTSNTDGNYAFPVTAIRLNVSAGTGNVTMIAIQGSRGRL